MEKHSHCIRGVCRLCGQARAIVEGRHPIPKENFARQIESAFDVIVGDDSPSVHPPFICKLCEVKLRQWWLKFSKKNVKKATCNIQLASFDQAECDVCRNSSPDASLSSQLAQYKTQAQKYDLLPWLTADRLQVMKMSCDGHPVVFLSIFRNLSWRVTVADVVIPADSFGLNIPPELGVSECGRLCQFIATSAVCQGNDDFTELIDLKKGQDGQVPVSITSRDVVKGGTIRHVSCQLLIEAELGRCAVCRIHRTDLSAMLHRLRSKEGHVVTASSTIPHSSMSVGQLQQKAEKLQVERRMLKRKSIALEEKVAALLEKEGVTLDPKQEEAMKATFDVCDSRMTVAFPEGSPSKLMWEQQRDSALKGKQMRWHPSIIRLCIALHSQSAAAYNLMRESGFMKLPHPSTLHPYSHFADASSGFSAPMLERICKDFHLDSCSEEERNVSLLFDEMKVKSGLVYSARTGKIVGFTDITEVSNEVSYFERQCKGEAEPEEASHVLVLMVRGLCSSLHVPVAYYPTKGISSSELYPCISEAIIYLEFAGFKVRSLVCDGASPNRKFFRLHGNGTSSSPTYSMANPVDPSRKVYFICDVPHLLKTTRNNLENSGYHNKTRNLTVCFILQNFANFDV